MITQSENRIVSMVLDTFKKKYRSGEGENNVSTQLVSLHTKSATITKRASIGASRKIFNSIESIKKKYDNDIKKMSDIITKEIPDRNEDLNRTIRENTNEINLAKTSDRRRAILRREISDCYNEIGKNNIELENLLHKLDGLIEARNNAYRPLFEELYLLGSLQFYQHKSGTLKNIKKRQWEPDTKSESNEISSNIKLARVYAFYTYYMNGNIKDPLKFCREYDMDITRSMRIFKIHDGFINLMVNALENNGNIDISKLKNKDLILDQLKSKCTNTEDNLDKIRSKIDTYKREAINELNAYFDGNAPQYIKDNLLNKIDKVTLFNERKERIDNRISKIRKNIGNRIPTYNTKGLFINDLKRNKVHKDEIFTSEYLQETTEKLGEYYIKQLEGLSSELKEIDGKYLDSKYDMHINNIIKDKFNFDKFRDYISGLNNEEEISIAFCALNRAMNFRYDISYQCFKHVTDNRRFEKMINDSEDGKSYNVKNKEIVHSLSLGDKLIMDTMSDMSKFFTSVQSYIDSKIRRYNRLVQN